MSWYENYVRNTIGQPPKSWTAPPPKPHHSSRSAMLTSRITAPPPTNPEVEDIFSSSHNILFTDDTQNSHGVPGGTIIYHSPKFGPLTLHIPEHPDVEKGRRLFAHYLWNAAVVAADLIESASCPTTDEDTKSNPFNTSARSVLELGAGTALPSLLSALSGARRLTVTDHPDSPSLTTGAIRRNIDINLWSGTGKQESTTTTPAAQITLAGYAWGERAMHDPERYGTPLAGEEGESYDRVLICDCLWMPSQHRNLARSAARWLSRAEDACVVVVAGFHTGRRTVGEFFDVACGKTDGEEGKGKDGGGGEAALRLVEIYEVDVDGRRREWQRERAEETKEQAKRWCVAGILMRR